MLITVNNPVLSTNIFIAIFIIALLVSLRKNKAEGLFPVVLTYELKGFAILAILFSHVGYFLSADHRFLFPLSVAAGVGVNLFLFLSGYGVTMSSLRKELTIKEFYKKRLLKILIPFWIIITFFFLLDYFILRTSYSWSYIFRSFAGYFPRADLFSDINSPLWFLTPIFFYYLIYPLVFLKKRPWLTALLIYIITYFILQFNLPISANVFNLYKLHILAFPLGIALAYIFSMPYDLNRLIPEKLKIPDALRPYLKFLKWFSYYAFLAALLVLIGYTAYYSGVGQGPEVEQRISLLTMSAIVIFFMMKKYEVRLFHIFGLYAFEIYLIHWPLTSRYDIFFRFFPGWLAMALYLAVLLAVPWLLVELSNLTQKK